MTLPVSSYEELLDRVRSLTHETRQLQLQIDTPILDCNENEGGVNHREGLTGSLTTNKVARKIIESTTSSISNPQFDGVDDGMAWTKEQDAPPEAKEQEETCRRNENDKNMKTVSHRSSLSHSTIAPKELQNSVTSETGLSYSFSGGDTLGTKVEMVYNLLSMLGNHDRLEMTNTLLAMSSSPDSCQAMRHSGCLSLLVQLVHSGGESAVVRGRASQALRNMVLCHGDDKRGRREARVLRLLDQLIAYCDSAQDSPNHPEGTHPVPSSAALMKLSFDEDHREAMCQLGAVYVIARLIQVESVHKMDCCTNVKRYGGMALTNLTFGDGNNKALLCSMKPFMTSLVAQLNSNSEDLIQVTASVLRNLSWRADASSKLALREVGAVPALMKAAMQATKEPTLKSVLSALWNLSAHSNGNEVDICAVNGAIQYLVGMLDYQSSSKTLAVVENAGGILRNISSHIAAREDYRKLLRDANCLVILLRQLQSASLTVVSNACGTLWNLSTRCIVDQRALVSLGAVPMLTSLAHSKHRMIAMGASAALKNLLPVGLHHHQNTASGGATLLARKKRALEAELNSTLSDSCEKIDSGTVIWDRKEDPQIKGDCEQLNRTVKDINIEESADQPVDYSLKYRETETRNIAESTENSNYTTKFSEHKEKKVYNGCFAGNVSTEGDYAETDLDQLTDYSLRYNEERSDVGERSLNQVEGHAEEILPRHAEPFTPTEPRTSPGKLESGKGVLETPLMFSRCSSLGSLGSCEPQVNDDCQSSVVSEFSRMTSGIMSPSDLPDSPTQTVPPSPKSKQPPIRMQGANAVKEVKSGGVFDDTVVAFKEESTPAQFSTTTSLSDLTFDDEPHHDIEKKEVDLPVVSEEEDENVLADCIKVGMQDNRDRVELSQGRVRPPRTSCIPVKAVSPRLSTQSNQVEQKEVGVCNDVLNALDTESRLSLELSDEEQDNVLNQCIQSARPHVGRVTSKPQTAARVSSLVKPRVLPPHISKVKHMVAEDEVAVFATEGSPRNFSVRSSLSDLTINTRPERSRVNTPPPPENVSPLDSLVPDEDAETGTAVSSEDVTLHQEDDQTLLMQVISSGMPSGNNDSSAGDKWMDANTSSFSAPTSRSFHTARDGVVELEGGGIALISHNDIGNEEPPDHLMMSVSSVDQGSTFSLGGCSSSMDRSIDNIQPPDNLMVSVTSLGDISTTSLNHSMGPQSFGPGLESIQPPSLLDSVLSVSSNTPPFNNNTTTLLEQVCPPADMDELLDIDNSISSVASLVSEVADDVILQRPKNDSRFNTYTVRSNDRKSGDIKPKDKVKQRRQADKERFRTRTLDEPINDIQRLLSVDNEGQTSTETSQHSTIESESNSEPSDQTSKPIIVKPPEVKSIRGGRQSSIPVVRSPARVPKKKQSPAPLQRQGTFTKEEPTSSIPVAVKKITSSPLRKIPTGSGRASSLPTKAGGVRPSSSNQSLKSASETPKIPVTTETPRWHSNSSLNSTKSPPVSKIASLWKKVDDSKKTQNLTKDSRVWIPPDPSM